MLIYVFVCPDVDTRQVAFLMDYRYNPLINKLKIVMVD